MRGTRSFVAAALCTVLATTTVARADGDESPPTPSSLGELPPLSYLWDGGAVPFLWGALAGRVMLDTYGAPPDSPRMFSTDEGGAPKHDWEMPGWGVSGLGGLSALGMIASGDESRWYHVKGMAQALATGCLVTGSLKLMFGRHRPSWQEGDGQSERRSFPSGHATQAFAIATYSILYLHDHVFDKRRARHGVDGVEFATYAGVALAGVALAGERVYHNRHHLSDVAIGGVLGMASSTAFYLYQEHRYRNHKAGEVGSDMTLMPSVSPEGISVQLGFSF